MLPFSRVKRRRRRPFPPRRPAEAPFADLTAAAFFDVDNTMMVGRVDLPLRPRARRPQVLHHRPICSASPGSRSSSGSAAARPTCSGHRDTALSFVAGHPVDEFIALGEEIYDELMADRIWAGTRALAQMHLDAGQRVWLVTATPVELASIIARGSGSPARWARSRRASTASTPGGWSARSCTAPPRRTPCARSPRPRASNLRRCTAYSDSVNDVPMLSAVGTAVAVNPDSELRDVAKARGWQIRDFRTGRKAAKIGVPSVLGAGALAGAVAAGVAYRRR